MMNSHLRPLHCAVLLSALLLGSLAHAHVTISEDVYEGRPQFKITTPAATWYYDQAGGGFSRLIDREGHDWIAFHKDPLDKSPASAAAGYRGLPNAILGDGYPDAGAGHPGFDRCVSTLLPDHVIRTVTKSGRWAWTWRFTDTHAIFTMEKTDGDRPWWFLYEGPINGKFSPRTHFWGTNDGGPRHETPDHKRAQDITGHWRWIYFGDRTARQTLLIGQIQPEAPLCAFSYFGSTWDNLAAPDGMTVCGFGRGKSIEPQLHGTHHSFVVGLVDTPAPGPSFQAQVAGLTKPWLEEQGPAPQPAPVIFRDFDFNRGAPDSARMDELQPKPTYHFTGADVAWASHFKRHYPRPITLDLAHATHAEFSFEYWGGHIGTSGQLFQVNGHGWTDLPQPAGTPTAPLRYYRTLLGNNAVPMPLSYLVNGVNQVQFAAGPQIAYSFGWGFYWIYDFSVRVYYDASRPHPTGEIILPKTGATLGDTLELETRASSPNGPIVRVEYIGKYDDFDWDGNGVWREWQYQTRHGVLHHNIGTATSAPWRVTWDAHWLPDQSRPVRIRARITDASGITYLTPAVTLEQRRTGHSVRMFKPTQVPERFSARAGQTSPPCTIMVDGDLSKAKAARLVVSTWNGSTDDDSVHEILLNGTPIANRFGRHHNYSFNSLNVPVALLRPGANVVTVHSTSEGHALEVNWPGPVLMVDFGR